MNLRDIMTRDVQCIRPDDTVQEAAEIMRIADVGALPVCEPDGIVVGMLTIGITWLLLDRLILRPIERRTVERWGLIHDSAKKI